MAVDSRNKRMSLVGFGLPVPRVLPNPDGSLSDGADRGMLLYLYHGIALETTALVPILEADVAIRLTATGDTEL